VTSAELDNERSIVKCFPKTREFAFFIPREVFGDVRCADISSSRSGIPAALLLELSPVSRDPGLCPG